MPVRKFREKYNDISEIKQDIKNSFLISESMIKYISFMIENDEVTDYEKKYLQESKEIIQNILDKYKDYYDNYTNQPLEVFQEDFNSIFEIENKIYNDITKRLWENHTTSMDQPQKQGDRFSYIVHYVEPFEDIKIKHTDGDFISATLSTDTKWGTFHSRKVGLILDPKRYIIFSTEGCSISNF